MFFSLMMVPSTVIYLILLAVFLLPELLQARRRPVSAKSQRFKALPLSYKLIIYAVILPLLAGITACLTFLPGYESNWRHVLSLLWCVVALPVVYAACEIICVRWYKKHGCW